MDADSTPSKQDKRKRQMLGATLRLLRKHGTGVTTAQIAAEAHCSKETLYNWFGDRDGIMLALIQEQAKGMNGGLAAGFEAAQGLLEHRLKSCATLLLDIMTGEAVLAVNRCAMAEACSERSTLGQAVLADWRAQVAAPFHALFEEGRNAGSFAIDDLNDAFETLIGLLLGDRQRRLLLGEAARPAPAEMGEIAERAIDRWTRLYQA